MKKLLLLPIWVALPWVNPLSCYGLPTYEPFTEFAGVAATNTVTNGAFILTNCIDLATGGYTAPSGEPWTGILYSASVSGNNTGVAGTDILLTNMPAASQPGGTPFSAAKVAALLPANFPGVTGNDITTVMVNNEQSYLYPNSTVVGNSAVLNFAQDITRPTSGTKTLYWSYLFSVAQKGQTATGNNGRYLGFLESTNLNIGTNNASYPTWDSFFNTFGTGATSPHYFGHGVYAPSSDDIEPVDSSKGLDTTFTSTTTTFGGASFIVGEFVFTTNGTGSLPDTNILWFNPSSNNFGGAIPPSGYVWTNVNITMSDVGGLVLIDRVGSGGLGGVGTNYIANLLIGSTWSYVTGGSEFTNAPAANTYITSYGQNVSMSGSATAANQSVTYQWQNIVAGVTNNLTNGAVVPGGTALVSGATSTNLTLTGVHSSDLGNFQLVATASSTGYTLAAPTVLSLYVDPHINSTPASLTTNYRGTVSFTVQIGTFNAPLTYGWWKNGTPLANGTQPGGSVAINATGTTGSGTNFALTLTLTNVSYMDDGNYTLYVTNAASQNNNSALASLTVNDPYIITQPVFSQVISVGGSATNTVVAAGSGITYQWYGVNQGILNNNSTFSGVTNATLTIANAQTNNEDEYYVIVGGSSGQTVQSANSILYVQPAAGLGPFATTNWPSSVTPGSESQVDYIIFDPTQASTFTAPSDWNNNIGLAPSGGDETWTTVTYDGVQGREMTGTYFNFVDPNWTRYTNYPVIDILMEVWGNSDMYDPNGNGLVQKWTLSGGETAAYYVVGGYYPLGANNGQWNWLLLSVTNGPNPNGDGNLTEGDPVSAADSEGGVNSGTIRLEGQSIGMTIAAVAMGPHGVFGVSNAVNRFAANANCPSEPTNNLAYIDFNQGIANDLTVLNSGSYSYSVQSGVGPANDQRTAIQCTSGLMNFGVLSNYLGEACNENLTMQVCLEIYDDPALAGNQFYPFDYATDAQGDIAYYPYTTSPYTVTGTGQWQKVAFFVGPANLQGINVAPLYTGGPEMYFPGTAPFIDRVELGVMRTGTNALAGQIPDPNYHVDPLICSTNYGYYAEWYPSGGVTNNLDVNSSYSTSLAGPAGNQEICLVPILAGGGGVYYLQWAQLNSVFGPAVQDNADVFMSLTYYDDPTLVSNAIYPNVYTTLVDGNYATVSPSAPYGAVVYLQGTGKWQTATWEVPNMNVANQVRFAASAPIRVSRVRYDVNRPCGTFEGINYLQTVGTSTTNHQISINWVGQASVVSATNVNGPYTNIYGITNLATNIFTVLPTNQAGFFRLQFPSYPPYLSTNTP